VCPDVTSCEQGVERSAYVHVGEQLRLEDRAGDRSLRSLMENDVASLGCGSNGVHITKIRAYEAHAGRPIEIRPRALRQIVEAHDRVSFGESRPARCEPMNPAAPVTSARIRPFLGRSETAREAYGEPSLAPGDCCQRRDHRSLASLARTG
jgi:hypothetical protein